MAKKWYNIPIKTKIPLILIFSLCSIFIISQFLRFVNLLQLHTNYDNLKNSPGLFSMWEAYNNTKLPEQRHDSLEDAMVTKDVFFKFKEKVNRQGYL